MDLTELVKATEQWFVARNLHNADPSKQMLKLYEEYGELCEGYLLGEEDVIIDSVGDMMVVLTGLALQTDVKNPIIEDSDGLKYKEELLFTTLSASIGGLSSAIAKNKGSEEIHIKLRGVWYVLEKISETICVDCVDAMSTAYDEIKDRKGKLIDGVFVKEEDLNEG